MQSRRAEGGRASAPSSLLDDVMPRYDVNEVHAIWVPADLPTAYAAVTSVRASEIRIFRPLMIVRALPRLLKGGRFPLDPSAPVLEEFLKIGFVPLGEDPDSELVVGAVGRFWSFSGNEPLRTIRSREDFVAFSRPGYAKAAMNFTVRSEGVGSQIATETRVVGTDARATRLFRRYWLLIRWASGAIRKSWLKAIRRRITDPSFGRPH